MLISGKCEAGASSCHLCLNKVCRALCFESCCLSYQQEHAKDVLVYLAFEHRVALIRRGLVDKTRRRIRVGCIISCISAVVTSLYAASYCIQFHVHNQCAQQAACWSVSVHLLIQLICCARHFWSSRFPNFHAVWMRSNETLIYLIKFLVNPMQPETTARYLDSIATSPHSGLNINHFELGQSEAYYRALPWLIVWQCKVMT